MRISAMLAALALFLAPTVASADPAAPQENSSCPAQFADVMTWLPEAEMPLVCEKQGSAYQWVPVMSPYPVSDQWLSYGPQLKLHGEGLRNAAIRSGDWTATPQDSTSTCRAEQVAVVNAGVVGSPQADQGAAGQVLSFQVLPQLFSITMSGYCLWTKV